MITYFAIVLAGIIICAAAAVVIGTYEWKKKWERDE